MTPVDYSDESPEGLEEIYARNARRLVEENRTLFPTTGKTHEEAWSNLLSTDASEHLEISPEGMEVMREELLAYVRDK